MKMICGRDAGEGGPPKRPSCASGQLIALTTPSRISLLLAALLAIIASSGCRHGEDRKMNALQSRETQGSEDNAVRWVLAYEGDEIIIGTIKNFEITKQWGLTHASGNSYYLSFGDNPLVCILSAEGKTEIRDIDSREVVYSRQWPDIKTVVPTDRGFFILAESGALSLLSLSATSVISERVVADKMSSIVKIGPGSILTIHSAGEVAVLFADKRERRVVLPIVGDIVVGCLANDTLCVSIFGRGLASFKIDGDNATKLFEYPAGGRNASSIVSDGSYFYCRMFSDGADKSHILIIDLATGMVVHDAQSTGNSSRYDIVFASERVILLSNGRKQKFHLVDGNVDGRKKINMENEDSGLLRLVPHVISIGSKAGVGARQ